MRTFLMIVAILAFFAPLLASAFYVPARLAKLLSGRKRIFLAFYMNGLLVAMVGMGATATRGGAALGVIYILGGILFIAHIYLTLGLLLTHGLSRLVKIPAKGQIVGVFALTLSLIAVGVWQSQTLNVEHVEIQVEGLESSVRVMHISDVHLGHHRGHDALAKIVEETNAQSPDFVVITGDLVDSGVALTEEDFAPLAELDAPAFYITGNHEKAIDVDEAISLVVRQGVHVMMNERVDIMGIQLVGLDYMMADKETFDFHPAGDRTISSELPRIRLDPARPVVALHHSPIGIDYMKEAGVDLVLAGHTHAGQVFPATLLAPLLFFEFNQGLYDLDGISVFVSQGAGTFGVPMRLGSQNTIHLLELVPAG